MHYLEYFNKKTIKYDLINKFLYKNTKELPKLKNLILHFNCNTPNLNLLLPSAAALNLITTKKRIIITFTKKKRKKSNTLLKIRKGNPVGCKVVLSSKLSYLFLVRFLNEILPLIVMESKKQKLSYLNLLNETKPNYYYCRINNPFLFKELENNFTLFHSLNRLDLFLVVKSIIKKDSMFFLKSFKLPNK